MAGARDELTDTVTDAVTRSFRPAFVLAAGLAGLAAVPALLVAARPVSARPRAGAGRRTWSTAGVGALVLLGLGVVGVELVTGAADTGAFVAADPCAAEPDPYPGGGLDGTVQEIALSTLNGAACELGTTRERLVLSLDPDSGFDDVRWDDETLETALRAGGRRAIADADDRDAIPGWVAAALGFVIERAPIGWLVEAIPIPGL